MYLELENNTKEDEKEYSLLLNNEDLSEENKFNLVEKVETKVSVITDVSDVNITDKLLEKSKIKPTWGNVLSDFEHQKNSFSNSMLMFLNNIDNAEKLSKNRLSADEKHKELSLSIVIDNELSIDSYTLLLKSISEKYTNIDFYSLSEDHVSELIINDILDYSLENHTTIKENFHDLLNLYVSKYFNSFIGSESHQDLSDDDFISFLKSKEFSENQKTRLLNQTLCAERHSNNIDLLKRVALLYLDINSFELDEELIKRFLNEDILEVDLK